jgi:hypothetical protein
LDGLANVSSEPDGVPVVRLFPKRVRVAVIPPRMEPASDRKNE